MTLGLNIENLSKILKLAGNDDIITLKAEVEAATMSFLFENTSNDSL